MLIIFNAIHYTKEQPTSLTSTAINHILTSSFEDSNNNPLGKGWYGWYGQQGNIIKASNGNH